MNTTLTTEKPTLLHGFVLSFRCRHPGDQEKSIRANIPANLVVAIDQVFEPTRVSVRVHCPHGSLELAESGELGELFAQWAAGKRALARLGDEPDFGGGS